MNNVKYYRNGFRDGIRMLECAENEKWAFAHFFISPIDKSRLEEL